MPNGAEDRKRDRERGREKESRATPSSRYRLSVVAISFIEFTGNSIYTVTRKEEREEEEMRDKRN